MTSPSRVLVDPPEGELYVHLSISFILWSMMVKWKMRSVENAECRKMRSVENAECGK